MKKHFKSLSLMLVCIMGLYNIGYAQSTYRIQDTKDVDMKLMGTSSMHDWEMEANCASGEAQFVFKSGSETEITSLKSLSFALKVNDL
jgi:hypothetical protein